MVNFIARDGKKDEMLNEIFPDDADSLSDDWNRDENENNNTCENVSENELDSGTELLQKLNPIDLLI